MPTEWKKAYLEATTAIYQVDIETKALK